MYTCILVYIDWGKGMKGERSRRHGVLLATSPDNNDPEYNSADMELMNQLHIIGPPPSRNDCLGFLGCFKDSRYANNAYDGGRCNGLQSIGIKSRF